MFATKQLLISVVIVLITLTAIDSKEEFGADTCQKGTHKMLVVLNPNLKPNAKGLSKFDYNFILYPKLDLIDNRHLLISGTFPINVNIDLSDDIIYIFESKYDYCLNDLIKGRLVTLLGNLIEYKSGSLILTGIWMQFGELLMNKPMITDASSDSLIFYLMSDYNDNKKNVILMTKIFDSWNKMAFQVIKARMLEKKNNKLVFYSGSPNDSIVLPIGTELKIQNEEKFLRDTTTYTANTVESGVTYNFNIDSITNYMCMKIENRKYTNKCY